MIFRLKDVKRLCTIKHFSLKGFIYFYPYFINSFLNKWDGNYWGPDYTKLYLIRGDIIPLYMFGNEDCIPFVNFDRNPAKEPNDINATKGCGIE